MPVIPTIVLKIIRLDSHHKIILPDDSGRECLRKKRISLTHLTMFATIVNIEILRSFAFSLKWPGGYDLEQDTN